MRVFLTLLLLAAPTFAADGDSPFGKPAKDINKRSVKIFGSGGFKGLISYGSGIVVSPQGHILTAATQLLDTQDLRVHLYDGRRFRARVIYVEPELDAALLEIKQDEKGKVDLDIPFYDVTKSAAEMKSGPGDWVLAASNSFQIATRDESMSLQRGVISAVSKLVARRGIFEAPYHGDAFFLDAITNNPGSAGGAVCTRDGKLIGMIGKEFRSTATDTWINYAVPINCKVEVQQGEKTRTFSLVEFVTEGIAGKYRKSVEVTKRVGPGAYHGIVFVPNIVEQTPAYVDRVIPGSPAYKAGLKPDDLLVYVDGEPVYGLKAFKEIASKFVPGSKVQLEVRRGDKLTAIEIELADFPTKN